MLIGYNFELSNLPFLEKRKMQGGFADSLIRLKRRFGEIFFGNINV